MSVSWLTSLNKPNNSKLFIKHKNYCFNVIILFKNLFTNIMECSADYMLGYIKRAGMTLFFFNRCLPNLTENFDANELSKDRLEFSEKFRFFIHTILDLKRKDLFTSYSLYR